MNFTADQIIALGGKSWTPSSGGPARVYLDVESILDLDIERYSRSGGIQRAWLNGDKISNAQANRLLASKVFLMDGKMHITGEAECNADAIHAAVANQVAALTPATVTARQAAEALGVHVSTIYRRIKAGKINATKVDGRWTISL